MRIGIGAIHLGDFVAVRAGGFSVPQNPVDISIRDNGMGDFVPVRKGGFSVPQNPVALSGGGHDDCGCGGSCGGCGGGMGDISSTWTALQAQTVGPWNWKAGYVVAGLLGAAVILPMWMSGRRR